MSPSNYIENRYSRSLQNMNSSFSDFYFSFQPWLHQKPHRCPWLELLRPIPATNMWLAKNHRLCWRSTKDVYEHEPPWKLPVCVTHCPLYIGGCCQHTLNDPSSTLLLLGFAKITNSFKEIWGQNNGQLPLPVQFLIFQDLAVEGFNEKKIATFVMAFFFFFNFLVKDLFFFFFSFFFLPIFFSIFNMS